MQWLTDFSDWFFSSDAQPVIFAAVVIAVAMIVSGLLAAWIARGTTNRVIAQRNSEIKIAAIAALIDASTEASVWNSLTPQEQVLSDRAVGQADIQVRMLPIRGSQVAADWAAHQLHELKRASATFGAQLDPAVAGFRDRLIEWQAKPGRARKAFAADLARWKEATSESERTLLADQDAWVAQQHQAQHLSPLFAQPADPTGGIDTQKLFDDVAALRQPAPVAAEQAPEPIAPVAPAPVAHVPATPAPASHAPVAPAPATPAPAQPAAVGTDA
ncbi:hypothetical protein [Microterricola viridarii]|uniref:Uncharacterized protein n=1 Tax=Microterricola viridarii TaxID=412690 RepID=A0A0X8E3G0_9MICO|nr:hypothetical protein [Microterricola viridarii]AMB58256.1 hypothetical protein AWU67_04645 [Microterricola viridarii]